MTPSVSTLELVRRRLANAVATSSARSADEQRSLLAGLLREAFEAHRDPSDRY